VKRLERFLFFCLLSLLLWTLVLIVDYSQNKETPYRANYEAYTARDFIAPLPDSTTPTTTPTATPAPVWLEQYEKDSAETREEFEGLTSYFIELEPIGKHYITAYSPQETGSWITASGIKLHRASYENRYTEPTTCAVDRKLYKIGENGVKFYIFEFDRVFIAQDTGGAVRGKHLDLAYTDLKSVKSFRTGNYHVYKVKSLNLSFYTKEDIKQDYYTDF